MSAEFAGSRGCSRRCIDQGGGPRRGGTGSHPQLFDKWEEGIEGVPGGDEGLRGRRGGPGERRAERDWAAGAPGGEEQRRPSHGRSFPVATG